MDDHTNTNPVQPGAPVAKTPAEALTDETRVAPPGYQPGTPLSPAGRDLSQTTLGDCRLERKLAVGGMGEVYLATQLRLDQQVAVKVLSSRLATQPEFLARFEREAKAAAALNHPNVVQVYDFGRSQGETYLMMEFVEGVDVSEYLKQKGKLSPSESLEIIGHAARALQFARTKSIIHRDIKPANLMRTTAGVIKVSDLGLAKVLTEVTEVTATGVGIGSPHFLAPEQADDAAHVDHRADIYSLGITLLYLLTGKHPFDGTSAYSVVLAHARRPLPTGAELGTELPPNIEAFIRRLAAKRPEDRYQDYETLLADLEQVKAGYAPSIRRPRGLPGWFSDTRVLGGIAAACIVLLVGIAITALKRPRETTTNPVPQTSGPHTPPPGTAGNLAFPSPPDRRPPRVQKETGPLRPGAAQGVQRYPLPLLSAPNFTPLTDGPIDDMLARADAFAAANPNRPVKIIDHYLQLWRKAQGTPREDEFRTKLDAWVLSHQYLVEDKLREFEAQTLPLWQAKRPEAAYEIWKTFPADLRTPEVDKQIQEVMTRHMPPDFTPR